MNKIIGFDSWTQGAHNFERLVPALESLGFELLLIHIGSYGHDINRPKEERIGKLLVRDISYYGCVSLIDVLKIEKPSVVLFLSVRAFAHMTMNRYANFLNIPTCHLYHGLVMVQSFNSNSTLSSKINLRAQLLTICERAYKNIFKLIPMYMRALWATNASFDAWVRLSKYILQKIQRGSTSGAGALDTKTSAGCVYSQVDVCHMHDNYGIGFENIYVVGNPDLIRFDLKQQDFGSSLNICSQFVDIIYIDTAYVESNMIFSSEDEYVEHLLITKDVLERLGFGFIFKPHPAHFEGTMINKIKTQGIRLCGSSELIVTLKAARAVIVEPSSAALIPGLMGLPLLLAQYGKLNGQKYGEVLTSYPRARALKDLYRLSDVLNDEAESLNIDHVQNWIDRNSGPMPAEDMPFRVAAVLEKISS